MVPFVILLQELPKPYSNYAGPYSRAAWFEFGWRGNRDIGQRGNSLQLSHLEAPDLRRDNQLRV